MDAKRDAAVSLHCICCVLHSMSLACVPRATGYVLLDAPCTELSYAACTHNVQLCGLSQHQCKYCVHQIRSTSALCCAACTQLCTRRETDSYCGSWSLCRLLEGLEMYGDNWAEVAEHVGSKSQVGWSATACHGPAGIVVVAAKQSILVHVHAGGAEPASLQHTKQA